MRVIVPYKTLWHETRAALEADGRQAEYFDVGHTPTAYHELMLAVWAEGKGFTVVEQDIVPYVGAIAELEACPEPWDGKPYWIGGTFDCYLGCTRFSDALVHDNPGLMESLDRLPDDGTPRRYWGRVDTRLAQVLRDQYGLHIHAHWPAVEHMNPQKLVRGGINCIVCGEPIAWKTVMRQPPPWPCEHDGSPFPEWQSRLLDKNQTGESYDSVSPIVNCSNCGEAMPCSCG